MSKQTKLFEEEELPLRKDIPLGEAEVIANDLLTLNGAFCERIEVVGAIRRRRPTVNDVDFVAVATDEGWEHIKENLAVTFKGKKVLSGPKILRFVLPFKTGCVQVDFYRAEESNYGILKLIRTGSAKHNVWLAKEALRVGMKLEYSRGLVKGEVVVAGKTEESVFAFLGYPYVKPEDREVVGGRPVWLR